MTKLINLHGDRHGFERGGLFSKVKLGLKLSVAFSWIGLGCLAPGTRAAAQTTVQLQTMDTILRLNAGLNEPHLMSLQSGGQEIWTNRVAEALIDHAEINGEQKKLHWRFNEGASQVETNHVAFVYETVMPHLRLAWEWRARASYGPIEHVIHIENLTREVVWLPLQDSFDFDWQVAPGQQMEQLYIDKGSNTPTAIGTHRVTVPGKYAWEGRSSTYALPPQGGDPAEIIPWFLTQVTGSAQSGWYVGIEFSGCTRLSLARDGDSLHGAAGLDPAPGAFKTRVEPGTSFETPTVFLGGSVGGPDAMGNVLRRWVREVLTYSRTWGNPDYPLINNNSWGSGTTVNEATAQRMIRDSAELGCEMFHIDAGWFRGVGDWYPDPIKFPHGLAVIADDAHRHGLKFGLWVDWTQAGLDTAAGALNARDPEVQDWLIHDLPKDWKPQEYKGVTIDLGVPAAKDWAQHEVNRLVDDDHLDMLEHDGYLVAKSCGRPDHPHAAPEPAMLARMPLHDQEGAVSANSTDVSYRATRAYYEIQSSLRKNHPDLLLEICNDGGRMVDFGSVAHGDYFSVTDTYDPLSNRRAFHDASYVLPPAMLESYVENTPTPNLEAFRVMLRSGMMGWLTIMLDTTAWTPEQHAEAKEEFHLYKTVLRPLIRDADLYHISPRPDGLNWDGIEYFDPHRGCGVVYAFRGSAQTEPGHAFQLLGMRRDRVYQLRFHDHSAPDRRATGGDLCEKGLSVDLLLPNSAELIFIDEAIQQK